MDQNTQLQQEPTAISSEHAALDEQANRIVMRYTMGNMAVGVVPFPLIDIAALTAVHMKMLHSLAKIYGVEFKASLGKSAISSLLSGAGPVYAAAPVAASISKFVPVIGTALSYSTLVVLNGASTYAIGKVFQQHFASGGTFLNFKPESVRGYFAEQLEKGKTLVKSVAKGKKDSSQKKTQADSEQAAA